MTNRNITPLRSTVFILPAAPIPTRRLRLEFILALFVVASVAGAAVGMWISTEPDAREVAR